MTTLTIFANFYINDEERLLRMKDSFVSFKDIHAEKWVVNIRGRFKEEAMFFLKKYLNEKLISYSLESKKGWFHDTKQMLKDIESDYVFLWLEDHINMIDVRKYQEILDEMEQCNSEYLHYSFFRSEDFGTPSEIYKNIEKTELKNTYTFVLDKEKNRLVRGSYVISILGFFSKELFKKIITRPPLLRWYPKQTPLDFEKGDGEPDWLPLNYAISKYELFACIDDGDSSLQARGLYPKRVIRPNHKPIVVQDAEWRIFFRTKIKKYIPALLYEKTIRRIVIFFRRLKRHLELVSKGM
ncbi:MAG: hypothetical protein WAV98_02680 [Minisyncoccia bacterium]